MAKTADIGFVVGADHAGSGVARAGRAGSRSVQADRAGSGSVQADRAGDALVLPAAGWMPADRPFANKAVDFGLRSLSALLLCTTFLFVWFRGFGLADIGVEFWVMCAAGACGLIVALLPVLFGRQIASRLGNPHALTIGVGLFALAVAVAANGPLAIGLNSYLNCASNALTASSGIMQPRFADGGAALVGVNFFTVLLSAATGVVCAFVTRGGRMWTAFALPALVVACVAGGALPLGWETGVFFAAAALCMVGKAVRGGADTGDAKKTAFAALGYVAACVLAVGLVVATGAYRLFDPGTVPQSIEKWRHGVAYESAPNILPEGDLRNVEAFLPSERVELTVKARITDPVYLRGFVGEHFSHGVWSGLTPEENAQYRDLFYSLHQQGFYGQSQLASAYEAFGQSGQSGSGAQSDTRSGAQPGIQLDVQLEAGDFSEMVVTNLGACRHYLFAPYGFAQSDYLRTNGRVIGDETIESSGSTLQWGLAYNPSAVRNSYILQQDLESAASGNGAVAAYLDLEGAYREMVYDTCLGLSSEHETLLEELLGQRERLSTTQARARISEYLATNQYYSSTASGNAGQDVLEWFLAGERVGHSVHYAMAATMMLRYYGVPARYVEGYVVMSGASGSSGSSGAVGGTNGTDGSQAGAGTSDTAIRVTDRSAHAWAEFYLDGVGWLPFETTPGYRNDALFSYPGMDDEDRVKAGEAPEEEDWDEWPEEEETEEESGEEDQVTLFDRFLAFMAEWWWAVLLALLALAALAAIAYVATKRVQLARVRSLFESEDARTATMAAFSYATSVVQRRLPDLDHTLLDQAHGRVAKAFACGGEFAACEAINARARFSSHDVSESDRERVVQFANDVAREYRRSRSLPQRLYDRLVACVY